MLWTKVILKSSFLKAVLMILLLHTAFRAKVRRNTLKTGRAAYIRRKNAARSLIFTGVVRQTLLLSCIGAKNCCQEAIISIWFPSSQKKRKKERKKRYFILQVKWQKFLFDFSQILYFSTNFLTSHQFHFSRKPVFGEALIHGKWQEDMTNVRGAFRMRGSDRIVELQHFAFMPSMNVTYVPYPFI